MRRLVILALLVGVGPASLLARTAKAEELELNDSERRSFRSGQSFGFSVHFGPYRPEIDDEFKGARAPYAEFYGNGQRLLTQFALEYQFMRTFGTLAVGVNAGYFSASAHAWSVKDKTMRSNDDIRLRLFPLGASLIYRLSVLNDRYGIPIAPYAKGGLDYVIWAVNDGNGEITSDGAGGKARGGTMGWHGTLGISLVLDFLDPDAAHEFDADTGVNHTHLFFEFTKASVNGLGQSHKLRVGDTTWNMGLLFEF